MHLAPRSFRHGFWLQGNCCFISSFAPFLNRFNIFFLLFLYFYYAPPSFLPLFLHVTLRIPSLFRLFAAILVLFPALFVDIIHTLIVLLQLFLATFPFQFLSPLCFILAFILPSFLAPNLSAFPTSSPSCLFFFSILL